MIPFVGNQSSNPPHWTTAVTGLEASVNSNVNSESHPLGALVSTRYLGSDGVTLTASPGSDTVTSGTGPNDGNTTSSNPGEGLTTTSCWKPMTGRAGAALAAVAGARRFRRA